jgi:hypothetical protein
MGIRLEVVFVFLIGLIVWGSFTVTLNQDTKQETPSTKELEFTNTTFIEVDTEKMQGHAYGTYGVRDNGLLTLDNVKYHTEKIKSLTAKKGKYQGDFFNLDGDVVMEDEEGYTYTTQHARYNKKRQILTLKTAFTVKKDKNIFNGASLVYHAATKEMYAKKVDAILYTVDK